jgi:site-specific recombinase XerD
MVPSISALLHYERGANLPRKTSKAFDEDKISLSASPPDSWDEVLAAFESDLFSRGRSETTVSTYAYALRAFGAFYRGHLKKPGPFVARLQETDVQAFIHYIRQERHLSAVSVNRHISALRAFSSFILVKGWHRRMVTGDLKTYHVYPSRTQGVLSASEERRLVKAVDLNGRNGLRDLAILQLFLQCGLQVSELVRLLRDDATIHKSVGTLRVRNEKGDQERTVPLNAAARKALSDYFKVQGPADSGAPLFLSERRGRIGVAAVQYQIKKYLCFAGREDLSTYDLRHHFASKFYAKSGNLPATQKILGQRNINTTARYAKAMEREIEEACDALDDRPE